MGSLAGKVLVVTGAGRGIGREVALLAAREGARVVVNDLGGSGSGEGSDALPAREVANLITADGGAAVADGGDVSDVAGAESIIASAIRAFGRIDCVVNNAGILRDRIFHQMSHEDWRKVVDVHLNGSFNVSRAAATFFREQGSGAFVHMTSTAGLIGNLGQANYAAAKLGIVGLSKSIALDMARFGVRSNCVAPFAWSRLVGAAIPADTPEERVRFERFKAISADKVAPLVVFLASDLAREVTGQIFGVRRNEIFLFSQPRPICSARRAEGWTVETIATEVLPSFRPSLYPLDRSADVFNWDPV